MSVSSSQGLTSSKIEDLAMTEGSKERDGSVTTEELGADQRAEESRLSQMSKCPSGSQPKDGENKIIIKSQSISGRGHRHHGD